MTIPVEKKFPGRILSVRRLGRMVLFAPASRGRSAPGILNACGSFHLSLALPNYSFAYGTTTTLGVAGLGDTLTSHWNIDPDGGLGFAAPRVE
jgi:hypothetical protein